MKRCFSMLLAVLLLAGCAYGPPTLGTRPTVEDAFQSPNWTLPVATEKKEGVPWPGETGERLGGSGQGLAVEMQTDETGRACYLYEGGEMCVKFWFEGDGFITREHGVGFLLFVNGRPQPYRLSQDGQYSYLHQFKKDDYTELDGYTDPLTGEWVPEPQYRLDLDFMFQPLEGQKGDYIECHIVRIFFPDYSMKKNGDNGIRPWTLALSSASYSFVLRFMEDPPETESLPVQDRLYDLEVKTVTAFHSDYDGWTNDDMLKHIRTASRVNSLSTDTPCVMWEITNEDMLEVQFEVWGSPLVQYRLVYFMNNQPVSVSEEEIIEISVESGKKTVVTARLDISDFDGESHIYCVLVPINRRQFSGLSIGLVMGSYVFLRDIPDPNRAQIN